MVPANARRPRSTRLIVTNGSTHPVQSVASLVICAIFVVLAQTGHARNQRVTLGTRRTDAVGAVSLRETFGSPATLRRAVRARVQTLVVVARLVVRAVAVALTFRCKK